MSNTRAAARPHILVIDDEPDLRMLYELTLLREGYQVQAAADLSEARSLLQAQAFELVISDMRLPDGLGTDLLRELRMQGRSERCIMITAYGSAENAVESLKAGAFDYLTKPVDIRQFRTAVGAALQGQTVTRAGSGQTIPGALSAAPTPGSAGEQALARMIGRSQALHSVRERIVRVARSMAPVLIHGESGTGKELVANALHANSHRAGGPWIAVNCGAIPESLLEAEFFGARKGAYTGASQDREGFFRAAHGGTLFLDEIGDLPLAMQTKLLRAIQERCIRPLGTNQEVSIDVRIVSATHKDLPQEVAEGRFRQDLYYRLNVIDIEIPALRERTEDLPELCQVLLARIARESGTPVKHLSEAALNRLCVMPMRGNVRELENILHRAVALSDGDTLFPEDIDPSRPSGFGSLAAMAQAPSGNQSPAATAPATPAGILPADLQAHLDEQEREILVRALRETGFNRTSAARLLGLTLRQIRYRIARLRIDAPEVQGEDDHA
jgi:two-component system, NtrC family, response regulator PilR